VSKSEWKGGLENAMNYYIENEEYEECSRIKKLIKKLQKK
jgi:protein-arginine kinase activator protein McsA